MITCREIMTNEPICCLPRDNLEQVAQLMLRQDIGAVLVVASHDTNKLIGIATDRDLTVRATAKGYDPRQTHVEAVLTPDPEVCQPHDPLEQAFRNMAQRQVRRLPVVDANGSVVGIITLADIATRADDPLQTANLVEQISQPVVQPMS